MFFGGRYLLRLKKKHKLDIIKFLGSYVGS